MFRSLWLFLLVNCAMSAAGGQASSLKPDQEIVFYPSIGCCRDGKTWELEIRGCVYEPDKRRVALALLREALNLKHIHLTEAENAIFSDRARLFMVDHKGGKRIVARIGERNFNLGKSRSDGHFSAVVRLSGAEAQTLRRAGAELQAVLRAEDKRVFTGEMALFAETGLTVISDIDDTIKVTEVRARKANLRHTFLEPFQPVPGMAEVYGVWARNLNAQFCYVSASPWQLFSPLSEFVRSNGFPAGAFYLKQFRWKDESFFSLLENPEKYKPAIIEPLLKQFPNRQFVLVGDSGERDPEIYSNLARRYPRQIVRILIRDVTNESTDAKRYSSTFHGLQPGLWKLFREPAEIKDSLDMLTKLN